jgi:hypothetical protein
VLSALCPKVLVHNLALHRAYRRVGAEPHFPQAAYRRGEAGGPDLRPHSLVLIYELSGLDFERIRELENGGEMRFRDLVCFDVNQCSVGDTSHLGQLLLCHELPAPQRSNFISQPHWGDYRRQCSSLWSLYDEP